MKRGAIWFASSEMLLVLKLIAARPKDWEDIKGILSVNAGKLDLAEVRRWVSPVVESAADRSRFEELIEEYEGT